MKEFTVGARVFCDFCFGGKPHGRVINVLKPGNGRCGNGTVRVKLTESAGAYRRGEIFDVSTFVAVPVDMELPLTRGEYIRRVSTLYQFNAPKTKRSSPGERSP